MAEKKEIEVFPFEANVNIKISGGFYTRLSEMVLYNASKHNIKDLTATLKEMETREPANAEEYHMLTLLTLIATIEREVVTQGILKKTEVTIPEENPEDTQETAPEN
jgi:hypothetical protein